VGGGCKSRAPSAGGGQQASDGLRSPAIKFGVRTVPHTGPILPSHISSAAKHYWKIRPEGKTKPRQFSPPVVGLCTSHLAPLEGPILGLITDSLATGKWCA
jgi:hypothetical protein